MVRFLGSFRMHWHRSHGPIFPISWNPKSISETLTMVIYVPGHGNPIKAPRKLANTLLNTKTTTNWVNNAWMKEFEFWKFKNKPNSVFTILNGFEQSKGLIRFWGCQGTCWTPQKRLRMAGSRIPTCLSDTVFLVWE